MDGFAIATRGPNDGQCEAQTRSTANAALLQTELVAKNVLREEQMSICHVLVCVSPCAGKVPSLQVHDAVLPARRTHSSVSAIRVTLRRGNPTPPAPRLRKGAAPSVFLLNRSRRVFRSRLFISSTSNNSLLSFP